MIDDFYIGKKFGKLTIISELEPIKDNNGTTRRVVTVLCECGSISVKKLKYLKSGDTKSCGAIKCRKTNNSDNYIKTKNRLIYGWGVNDIDRPVTKHKVVHGKVKQVWMCPYYDKWKHIIQRCFDVKCQEKRPTYKGCTVCEDWKYLSNFIKWVDSQPNKDWQNCEPDKDLLIAGNKHYSPETVVFIAKKLNVFITDSGKIRGNYMIGVNCDIRQKMTSYISRCSNPFVKGKLGRYIGVFKTELEAHKAWQAKKHEYACQLADLQEDERVAKALRERYAPDKDWTNK